MDDAVSTLRNLGEASARMLAEVGIHTGRELDAVGSVEAYRRVVAAGSRPSLNLLWALEAALLDIDWRSLTTEDKDRLLMEYGGRTD